MSTAQVPKQGLNLHRESAFCVAPVAQVSALKWNLRHLRLNLRHRGAEDMTAEYHDYWFHVKGSLIGMVLAIPSVFIAGIIVVL